MNACQIINENGKINFLNLKVGLSHFGLNPQEWELIPKSKYIFLIQNKDVPSLSLRGRYSKPNSKPAAWIDISLFSL